MCRTGSDTILRLGMATQAKGFVRRIAVTGGFDVPNTRFIYDRICSLCDTLPRKIGTGVSIEYCCVPVSSFQFPTVVSTRWFLSGVIRPRQGGHVLRAAERADFGGEVPNGGGWLRTGRQHALHPRHRAAQLPAFLRAQRAGDNPSADAGRDFFCFLPSFFRFVFWVLYGALVLV